MKAIDHDSDAGFVSDFIYGLIKKLSLKKSLTVWNGFIIFNVVFGINVAKEIQTYVKYLDALFQRAHRGRFIRYEVLLSLQYKLCRQYPEHDFSKFVSTIMMHFYKKDVLDKEFI